MAAIIVERVQKAFGSIQALEDISLEVRDGEFVALLGPSGCGKTTLLRIVAGLESQTSGRILIGGRDVSALPPRGRKLAMVFQNYAVFPHMTVRDNVGFGLRMAGEAPAKIDRQVERAAALMHIGPFLDRYPAQLSGGQRQRVAVARALAVEPAVLLMDEPLSNLDALLRLEMRAELKSVLSEVGTTTLYVTHDQTEAMGLADRIAVIQAGRMVQVGTPLEIYHEPSSMFVGGFVGSPPMNFIQLDVFEGFVTLGGARFAVPAGSGGKVMMGVRPEDFELTTAPDGVVFAVRVVEPLGAHVLLTGEVMAQQMRVTVAPDCTARGGDTLHLRPLAGRIRWMSVPHGQALGMAA